MCSHVNNTIVPNSSNSDLDLPKMWHLGRVVRLCLQLTQTQNMMCMIMKLLIVYDNLIKVCTHSHYLDHNTILLNNG